MSGIGHKIKKVRELRNFTQEYMASKLSMSQVNYSRIERDEIQIKPDKVEKIANILDVDKEKLLSFDERNVFNITSNQALNNVNNGDLFFYHIDPKIEKLYEDKIKLLEEKIQWLEDRLKVHS